jgi:hypothetical protein
MLLLFAPLLALPLAAAPPSTDHLLVLELAMSTAAVPVIVSPESDRYFKSTPNSGARVVKSSVSVPLPM